jgi:hypothetical protein
MAGSKSGLVQRGIFDPATSCSGQNPNLPPCNMHGCFSSNSGHASLKAQALPYSSNLCWGLVFAGILIPIAFADSAAARVLELVHEMSPGGLTRLVGLRGPACPHLQDDASSTTTDPVVIGRRCCQSQASGAMSST